ncbi:radical SAM protein [Chloroflexota bacterium]
MVIIRPPSEASSLLLPVTLGCSNNTCTFCGTYKGIKFRIRGIGEIKSDIDKIARSYSRSVGKVFLENGDALVCSQAMLVEVMEHLNKSFPNMERVGTYASPQDLLRKSLDDLKVLKELKLGIIYLGVETGDEELLKRIQKGVTSGQMVEAGRRAKAAGIDLSVTIILGLGGVQGSEQHALQTARVVSEIDPEFCGALTLMLDPKSPLYEEWQSGEFVPTSPFQSLEELRQIIAKSNFTDCFFTSNHASNYLPLRLRLPKQKEEGLKLLDRILAERNEGDLKPEHLRAL